MASSTVTNQINYHIFPKFITIIGREHGGKHYCIWIVTIHMEYRGADHFGNVGAIFGRAGIILSTRCKTDLVINDYVNSPAGLISSGLGQLECLHYNPLARKCSISMNQNRYYFLTGGIISPVLSSSTRTYYYRA